MAVTTAVSLMLDAVPVIHRYGRPEHGDRIVFVATASEHREGAHFLIDWLKTEAPFCKNEEAPAGETRVEARAEDDAAGWRRGSADNGYQFGVATSASFRCRSIRSIRRSMVSSRL